MSNDHRPSTNVAPNDPSQPDHGLGPRGTPTPDERKNAGKPAPRQGGVSPAKNASSGEAVPQDEGAEQGGDETKDESQPPVKPPVPQSINTIPHGVKTDKDVRMGEDDGLNKHRI